jgi:hypothetical protein
LPWIPFLSTEIYELPFWGSKTPSDIVNLISFREKRRSLKEFGSFPLPAQPGPYGFRWRRKRGLRFGGDLVLLRECFEPDQGARVALHSPGRYYNMVEIWHSMERSREEQTSSC